MEQIHALSRRVVDQLFEDWEKRWFPRRAAGLGRQTLLALMGEDLRRVMRLEDPSRRVERLLRASARAYVSLMLVRLYRSIAPGWTTFAL